MSKHEIGEREAALRRMREAQFGGKPVQAAAPALPKTSGKKPVKRKRAKR
jgi:hypothetical protein